MAIKFGSYKTWILIVISAALSCWAWSEWRVLLKGDLIGAEWSDWGSFIALLIHPVVIMGISLATASLSAMAATKLQRLVLAMLIAASTFIFFSISLWLAIGALVIFLVLLVEFENIFRHVNERLRVRFGDATARPLKGIIWWIILASAIMYYPTATKLYQIDTVALPAPVLKSALSLSETTLQNQIPGFSADQTIDQLTYNMMLAELNIDPTTAPSLESVMSAPEIAAGRDELLKGLGITQPVSGSAKVGDIVADSINQTLRQTLRPYAKFIPIVATVVYFLLLQILTPFIWLVGWLAGGVIWLILRATGFAKITKESRETEVLHI